MTTERDRLAGVRALFERALVLSPAERAAFLAAQSDVDAALVAEVRSLLDADEAAAGGVIDRLAARLPSLADVLDEQAPTHVGPYEIIEEAGRGGMGVVYRAHDPRLRRDVALKFLPRALVRDAVARARFIDEARAASALDHAGICTIHDIGSSDDGRLYIAMAWYAGGTLADRLRHGPLPVDEAVHIATQVAVALDRAHRAGIVHRDVKPANIAFGEAGSVKVLDFGVAALEADAAAGAAGTPRYMAPEQLRGAAVDRRADVWALGAVLQEMVAGEQVPPALTAVIGRACADDPDDRYPTAADLAHALRAVVTPAAERPRRRSLAAAAIAIVALSTLVLVRAGARAPDPGSPDAAAVAVLPFRVSGDPSLAYLREGMVDLLAAKLTGEGGLRAADPRTVYSALRRTSADDGDLAADAARTLARGVGAGNVLLGDVVGTPGRMVINTTMLDVRGRVVGRASVQGEPATLPELVDRLVAQLLSASAGEAPQRVAALTTTSLPALRAFLEGQAAYRRGRYEDALRHYGHALELDSTFALAGVGLELAGGWVGGVEQTRAHGRDVAWRYRDRLGATDRALLVAAVGPAYPHSSSIRETIAAVEDALRLAPDRVELWYMQADAYFHHGRVMAFDDWEQRAQRGFRRAIELDSSFAAPLHHLALLHARRGEQAAMESTTAAQLANEPAGSTADFLRWRRAVARGERAGDVVSLDSLAVEALGWIAMIAQDDGVEPDMGRRAIEARATRPGTAAEHFERRLGLHAFALNGGRPQEALRWTERLREGAPDRHFHLRLRILDALWADGDSIAAAQAATALAHEARELVPTADGVAHAGAAATVAARMNRCVLEQWRYAKGGTAGAAPARPVDPAVPAAVRLCEAVADALREGAGDAHAAGPATVRLDSMLAEGPFDLPTGDGTLEYVNSALARAWERAGDERRALDAIGRRIYFLGWQGGLAASLRDEARLALAVGDTARARRATEHYLTLRGTPEPELRAEVERMRRQRGSLIEAARRR